MAVFKEDLLQILTTFPSTSNKVVSSSGQQYQSKREKESKKCTVQYFGDNKIIRGAINLEY
jgi:hypothetical protein